MNPLLQLFVRGHVRLYQWSSGKRGATLGGMPVILLSSRGRKSGVVRTVPVVPFREGNETYVMASMGGSPRHPAWFLNLEANPEVDVQAGADRWHARAEVLPENERARIWPQIVAAMPNFGEYQTKTTRLIPVVRLVRSS